MMKIEKLTPFLARKLWGSDILTKLKLGEVDKSLEPVGESLEISRLKSNSSRLQNGIELAKFISLDELPYLVKIIETTDNLSIQVHPDDEYAKAFENGVGKSECWLILDAQDDAGIYLGFKSGVNKEDFKKAIQSHEDASRFLNFYPVKEGDFFYVPAKTIHAIGKNIRLAEVQQSSGITYRVWDWNRVDSKGDSRELHIRKAFDVMNFDKSFNSEKTFQIQRNIFENSSYLELFTHRDFKIVNYRLTKENSKVDIKKTSKRFSSILNLKGCISIKSGEEVVELDQYESVLFNKSIDDLITIVSEEDSFFIFIS